MILYIKLFPEIIIKSKPVRRRFIKMLARNIKTALKEFNGIQYIIRHDRLEIESFIEDKKDEIISILKFIPGIQFIELLAPLAFKKIDEIGELIVSNYADLLNKKSFSIRPRVKNYASSTLDVARELGSYVLEHVDNTHVDLSNPDYEIRLYIDENETKVLIRKEIGVSGYPVGSNDKVLSLISGGYDSGVSSFLFMKNGAKVDFLFFNLGGRAHEIGVKEVSSYLSKRFSSGYSNKFYSVDFEDVVKQLLTKINHKYRGVILKRLMMKTAEQIARKNRHYALVTGESIGQVSSQTLVNLNVISQSTDMMLMRPLQTMDKQEIIDIAKRIGTEPFAKVMPEFCGVISDHPSTAASLNDVLEDEKNLDTNTIENVLKTLRYRPISEFSISHKANEAIIITTFPKKDEIIVDVRDEDKQKSAPLNYDENKVLSIPFYQISSKFKELEQDDTYLFYCEKGVVSNLMAASLIDEGFENIKVLRPFEKKL